MKKLIYGAAIASVLAFPLAAQAAGYVELGVGQTHYNLNDTGVISEGSNPTAWNVALGADFTPNFAAEIGYTDLGSIDRNYFASGLNFGHSYKTRVGYVAAVGNAPLSEQFTIYGKLGATYNSTDGQANLTNLTFDGSEHKTGYLAAVGAAYNFTPQVAGTFGYDYYGNIADNANAGVWKVGVRARF